MGDHHAGQDVLPDDGCGEREIVRLDRDVDAPSASVAAYDRDDATQILRSRRGRLDVLLGRRGRQSGREAFAMWATVS